MARIVELTYPDNVTLLPGATQNWRDLPDDRRSREDADPGTTAGTAEDAELSGTRSDRVAAIGLDPAEADESPDSYVTPDAGDIPGPGAASPLLHGIVDRLFATLPAPARRCLVIGPHDPRLLARIAERVTELTVVVRAIPDAATIGTALPQATVLCGNLAAARRHGGTYDLVLALDDVTRVHSLEDPPRSWRELADEVVACVATGGTLALGLENDLGLHRVLAPEAESSRDLDGNWSPLASWDASRPRTPEQVAEFAAAAGAMLAGACSADRTIPTGPTSYQVFPDWRAPHTAGTRLDEAAGPLRDLLAALAGRPVTDRPPAPGLLQRRAVAMADRWPDVCAGWVLLWGPGAPAEEVPALLQARGDGRTIRWVAAPDGRVRRTPVPDHDIPGSPGIPSHPDAPSHPEVPDPSPVAVPPLGRTLLLDLVEAATESDTPRLRRLLGGWRRWLESHAADGVLPAAYADARFGNLLAGTDTDPAPVPLEPAAAPAGLPEVIWVALADLLATWRAAGIRTPWPTSMHPHTVFRALAAMAAVPAPDDVARYWPRPDRGTPEDRPMTRQEMMAVITRQREQLHGAWSRFHWDEKQYLTYRAETFAGRVARRLKREAVRGARTLTGRDDAE